MKDENDIIIVNLWTVVVEIFIPSRILTTYFLSSSWFFLHFASPLTFESISLISNLDIDFLIHEKFTCATFFFSESFTILIITPGLFFFSNFSAFFCSSKRDALERYPMAPAFYLNILRLLLRTITFVSLILFFFSTNLCTFMLKFILIVDIFHWFCLFKSRFLVLFVYIWFFMMLIIIRLSMVAGIWISIGVWSEILIIAFCWLVLIVGFGIEVRHQI